MPPLSEMLPPHVIDRWLREFEDERWKPGTDPDGNPLEPPCWPDIIAPRRDGSNIALLLADDDAAATTSFDVDALRSGFDALRLGPKFVTKRADDKGARSYRGILYTIHFCRELRRQGVTCTQRELYYNYKGPGNSPWRSQAECNESIADAAAIFQVPRFALGLTTAPRGMVAGRVRWRAAGDAEWTSAAHAPQHVDHRWLTDPGREMQAADARCVVVVEKDGVFQRLVEDRFFVHKYPCVLVTAMGVPDLATRALVHRLRTDLGLPVFGLVDWNSWGVGVLLCYKLGSARLGVESHRYTVDVKWLGLRTSQVDLFRIPDVCMQPLTAGDRRRGEGLLEHPWIASRPLWRAELERQLAEGRKCELEALNLETGGGGDFGFRNVGDFTEEAIVARDWLE